MKRKKSKFVIVVHNEDGSSRVKTGTKAAAVSKGKPKLPGRKSA